LSNSTTLREDQKRSAKGTVGGGGG